MDASIIVKLYIREEHSRDVSDFMKENNEAIPLTRFHDLEFINAINLKKFRGEITDDDARFVKTRFREHQKSGVYYRPIVNWSDAFTLSVDLSEKHTPNTGSRSLDILHVAAALTLVADGFLTFDERQSALATQAGLELVHCTE